VFVSGGQFPEVDSKQQSQRARMHAERTLAKPRPGIQHNFHCVTSFNIINHSTGLLQPITDYAQFSGGTMFSAPWVKLGNNEII